MTHLGWRAAVPGFILALVTSSEAPAAFVGDRATSACAHRPTSIFRRFSLTRSASRSSANERTPSPRALGRARMLELHTAVIDSAPTVQARPETTGRAVSLNRSARGTRIFTTRMHGDPMRAAMGALVDEIEEASQYVSSSRKHSGSRSSTIS
jgi:hypothetical protein